MRRFLYATLLFSVVSTLASAQSRVCMGGDLDKLTAAEKSSCSSQMNRVQGVIDSTGAKDWHVIVVCGRSGWTEYSDFSMKASVATADFDVDAPTKTIFLRGDGITTKDSVKALLISAAAGQQAPPVQIAQK